MGGAPVCPADIRGVKYTATYEETGRIYGVWQEEEELHDEAAYKSYLAEITERYRDSRADGGDGSDCDEEEEEEEEEEKKRFLLE